MLKIEDNVYAKDLLEYYNQSIKRVKSADVFIQNVRNFRCRNIVERENGKAPAFVQNILCEGTQEEADAGLFVSVKITASNIKPWSLMGLNDVPFANNCIYVGIHPFNGPDIHGYIEQYVSFGSATHIFISNEINGECADFFFPIGMESMYLRITVNARYGTIRGFLFEGNPVEFAPSCARQIRMSEYGKTEHPWCRIVCPVPTKLPLTRRDSEFVSPEPVTVRNFIQAANVLKYIPNEHDDPYLVG